TGPWKGSGIAVDSQWLVERLRSRIHEIEWKGAAEDLYALVPREVQAGLKSWSCPLFLSYCDRMLSYL
ncbi:MAG: nucleotidyl transferase AbiEii/AbiGii toxin family protein, partial [Chlamydiia bacterium]|nr:nucleotidyl transferase AbiEii/AbiGii toxin family protein [Chlamydiia bacterium]